MSRLETSDYRTRVERGFLIRVEGFDWNCPQHIIERYTLDEMRAMTAPLISRIAELEAELALASRALVRLPLLAGRRQHDQEGEGSDSLGSCVTRSNFGQVIDKCPALAKQLADWLRQYPNVEQAADRFHLLQNLRARVEH